MVGVRAFIVDRKTRKVNNTKKQNIYENMCSWALFYGDVTYIISNGKDAAVGSKNLWRQRKSRTLSANPKKAMQQTDNVAARNSPKNHWSAWNSETTGIKRNMHTRYAVLPTSPCNNSKVIKIGGDHNLRANYMSHTIFNTETPWKCKIINADNWYNER